MYIDKQPAKESYFFGAGWQDLGEFIRKLWDENKKTARSYYNKYEDKGLMSFKGICWLVASMPIGIYGTILFGIISAIMSIVLSVLFVGVYICFGIVWTLDRVYLRKNKIFAACPECKNKFLIPVYVCPECGAKHTMLTPGKYGVLKRKCSCGKELGTCFLTGRKNYPSICGNCGYSLYDRENMPICIPIVGGRSVGKTAFITAFSTEFINNIVPRNNWTVEFYNKEKEDIYQSIESDYKNGTTRMTERSYDINKTSSISFSFFLKGKELKPERLMHIYDIPGEVFTDNSENEIQKQYEYCHGIVLMIDPLSISGVIRRYEAELEEKDIAGIGKADISGIVDSFINKLREVTGLSQSKMVTTPIAIVISKIDIDGIKNEIGKTQVIDIIEKASKKGIDIQEMDAEDYLCRRFLTKYGMENLINQINIRFKNNRYFTCSSIGHTREEGVYRPIGVMEPMEWIIQNTDPTMAKKLSTHKFGKVPLKLEV